MRLCTLRWSVLADCTRSVVRASARSLESPVIRGTQRHSYSAFFIRNFFIFTSASIADAFCKRGSVLKVL